MKWSEARGRKKRPKKKECETNISGQKQNEKKEKRNSPKKKEKGHVHAEKYGQMKSLYLFYNS